MAQGRDSAMYITGIITACISVVAIRGINPLWEGDYATVHFSFVPPNGVAYPNQDIYLFGQLTNYNYADSLKMNFNPDKGFMKHILFMKQGYYDYTYIAVDKNNPANRSEMDGNNYEAENLYTILGILQIIHWPCQMN